MIESSRMTKKKFDYPNPRLPNTDANEGTRRFLTYALPSIYSLIKMHQRPPSLRTMRYLRSKRREEGSSDGRDIG